MNDAPIGVFDSGLGGLNVLAQLLHLMPGEDYVFFGDTGNNPYGTKPVSLVQELTWAGVNFLISHKIKALVIACNTATSVVIDDLREKLEIPVFGIEPAVKPALTAKESGKILIMATPLTIAETKFRRLLATLPGGKSVIPLACPGLAERVEQGDNDRIRLCLQQLFSTIDKNEIHSVVLGCTHYALIKEDIQSALGNNIRFFDGAEGLARHVQKVLDEKNLICSQTKLGGKVEYHITGNQAVAQTERAKAVVELLLSRLEKELMD